MKPSSSERVALLLPDLRAGGAQRVFLTLAREFVARGIKVDLILAVRDGELLEEVPPDIRVIPLRQRMPAFGRATLALYAGMGLVRYLRRDRPQALLSTVTGANLVATVASGIAGVPIRLIIREAVTLKNLRHRAYRLMMRWLYRRADAVVVMTGTMKEEMEQMLGLPSERVVCISNPVDTDRLDRDAQVPLPEDFDARTPYALAVGRLSPQKDYQTLIEAFRITAQATPLRLVILGEGPDRSKIEAHIRESALEDRIELRGFDPNPYRWMARAALFVLSSRWEGYPNVIAEARTLGCPVVMTEYDASAWEIGGDHAFLAPVGDAQTLSQGMLQTFKIRGTKKVELLSERNAIRDYLRTLRLDTGRS